jgi:phosphatidylglycerophosphate synthase
MKRLLQLPPLALAKNLSIPDWLSLYRILAAPVLVLVILYGRRDIFAALLLMSFLTDVLDGYIARRLKITSEQGAKLDSMGDLVTVVIGVVAFCSFETGFVLQHLQLIGFAVGAYLICLCLSLYKYGKPSSFHTWLSKTTAVVQGLFLLASFTWSPNELLLLITVVLSVLASLEEIVLILLLPTWKTNVKGLYWVLGKNTKSFSGKRNI